MKSALNKEGWKLTFLGFLLVALLVPNAWSQGYRATITGVITDPSGGVIPNAKVTVKDNATNFLTSTVTNSAGTYSTPFLTPGTYTVTVTAKGFQQGVRDGVVLNAGDLIHVNITMSVGAVSQSVTISAEGEMLQTASASTGQVISGQQVANLPIIGRNTYMLAATVPGMYSGLYQGRPSEYGRPYDGAAFQMSAEGSPGQSYQVTLNGLPNDLPERASGATYTGFVPPPDAVQEVNVQTSLYDAEYGHTSGVVVNSVLKSGTNQYHGEVYWYLRNTILNANCYQCNYAHQPTAVTHWNEPGLIFDGPVQIPGVYNGKDKTFFMVSYEMIRNTNPTPGLTTVPTQAEKNGNFQGLTNSDGSLITIYDPSTTVLSGNGDRTPFANNTILPGRIDPVAAKLLQYFPSPNVPANAEGFNNFVFTPNVQVDKYYALAIRLDHQLTPKNKLTGTFVRNVRNQITPTAGLAKVASSGYSHFRNNIGGSLDWTSILSPSAVFDTRVGVMYHPFSLQDYGDYFDLSSLGFPSSLLSALPNQTFPNIQLSNYTSLGAGGSQFSTTAAIDSNTMLSKNWGHHLLKVGFQFDNMRATLNAPESRFGNFGFNGMWTQSSAVNASGTSGWDFADFLLGYPDGGAVVWNNAYAYQRNYYAVFFQDNWRVSPRLTLNMGVRWSYESPFSERYNRQNAGFCTTCTNPISPLVAGFRPLMGGLTFTTSANRIPFKRDLNNVGPRLGFAYRMTSKSVLRGGFGILYGITFDTGQNNGYSVNTSYVATTNNFTPANVLSDPYPQGINVPAGSSEGLSTLLGSGFTFGDPGREIPRVVQFSLGLQYQLPSNMLVGVSYFGNRATLETSQSINALPSEYFPQGATALDTLVPNPMYGYLPSNSALEKPELPLQNLLVPYPEFGGLTESNLPYGRSTYNSLQASLTKRMTHGLTLRGSFTWAKIMDRNSYLNASDPVNDPARYENSQPNLYFTLASTWSLPFFAHSRGLVGETLGGWQTNAIFRWEAGSLVGNPSGAFATGVSPTLHSGQQTRDHWFNTCTVTLTGGLQNCLQGQTAADASWIQQPAFTLRTLSSTMPGVRTHVTPNLDLSLFKRFRIRENLQLEAGAEAFNFTNSVQFGGPNTSLNSSQFGVIANSQVNDPRIMQLTMKLLF